MVYIRTVETATVSFYIYGASLRDNIGSFSKHEQSGKGCQ